MAKLLDAGIIQKLNEIAMPSPKLYECVYTVEASDENVTVLEKNS